jgi:hypothetical protein
MGSVVAGLLSVVTTTLIICLILAGTYIFEESQNVSLYCNSCLQHHNFLETEVVAGLHLRSVSIVFEVHVNYFLPSNAVSSRVSDAICIKWDRQ